MELFDRMELSERDGTFFRVEVSWEGTPDYAGDVVIAIRISTKIL